LMNWQRCSQQLVAGVAGMPSDARDPSPARLASVMV
jgi:hypothetical protein